MELYGVYYITGLPVSVLQQRYDTYWDMKFGSPKMYLFRGQMCFLIILGVVLLMPMVLLERGWMLVLMAALGVSSWMLHGTACMLASMVNTSAISALQTGFRTPELLAIIACYYLNIGSTASPGAIRIFFIMMAVLALCGLLSWTTLLLAPKIQSLLADKDRCVNELDMTRAPLIDDKTKDQAAAAAGGSRGDGATAAFRRSSSADAVAGAASAAASNDDEAPGALEGDEEAEAPKKPDADDGEKSVSLDALSGNDMEDIAKKIWPCRVALFWTMFGSIFTAAFFA